MSAGGKRSVAGRQSSARRGIRAAIAFREARRCRHCGALGYEDCAHRPNGADGGYASAWQGFPFANHRTCAEWMGATDAKIAAGEGRITAPVAGEAIARSHGSAL